MTEIEEIIASAQTEEAPKRQRKARAASSEPSSIDFVSKERESHQFQIIGIRPSRSNDGRLHFEVPADEADRFSRHHHVVTGRVIRKK